MHVHKLCVCHPLSRVTGFFKQGAHVGGILLKRILRRALPLFFDGHRFADLPHAEKRIVRRDRGKEPVMESRRRVAAGENDPVLLIEQAACFPMKKPLYSNPIKMALFCLENRRNPSKGIGRNQKKKPRNLRNFGVFDVFFEMPDFTKSKGNNALAL